VQGRFRRGLGGLHCGKRPGQLVEEPGAGPCPAMAASASWAAARASRRGRRRVLAGRRHQAVGVPPCPFLVEVDLELQVARAPRGEALDLLGDAGGERELAVRGVGQGHSHEAVHLAVEEDRLDLRLGAARRLVVGVELEQPAAALERLSSRSSARAA